MASEKRESITRELSDREYLQLLDILNESDEKKIQIVQLSGNEDRQYACIICFNYSHPKNLFHPCKNCVKNFICKTCYDKMENYICPCCKSHNSFLVKLNDGENHLYTEMVCKLLVSCKFCKEPNFAKNIFFHLKECKQREFKCDGCGEKYHGTDAEKHKLVLCPECKKDIPFCIVYSHKSSFCEMRLIDCLEINCGWKGRVIELETHLNKYCPVILRNCMCGEYFHYGDGSCHNEKNCPMVKINCPDCKVQFSLSDITKHELVCPMGYVTCELCCEEKLLRKNLYAHKLNDCLEVDVKCPFYDIGCYYTGKRREINLHLKLETNRIYQLHFQLMKEKYKEKFLSRNSDFDLIEKHLLMQQDGNVANQFLLDLYHRYQEDEKKSVPFLHATSQLLKYENDIKNDASDVIFKNESSEHKFQKIERKVGSMRYIFKIEDHKDVMAVLQTLYLDASNGVLNLCIHKLLIENYRNPYLNKDPSQISVKEVEKYLKDKIIYWYDITDNYHQNKWKTYFSIDLELTAANKWTGRVQCIDCIQYNKLNVCITAILNLTQPNIHISNSDSDAI